MVYTIENEGSFYTVKQGGKVHMKAYPPTEGGPKERIGSADTGPDVDYSIDLGVQAVRYVRSQLPRGAFNNQMEIDGRYQYMTGNVSPKWLAARAETMYSTLAFDGDDPRDPITQMAARSLATRTVGGGVCSLLTYVTAGYLTTIAKRGTKIVAVFDSSFDHEYVVLYYGTSPYIVADPWVGTSYVCRWDHCYFPPDDIGMNVFMEIGETLTTPFGVTFTDEQIRQAKVAANIAQIANPPEKEKLTPDKQGLRDKGKVPWFHMDGAYAHPSNIADEHAGEYDPVAGPKNWGP